MLIATRLNVPVRSVLGSETEEPYSGIVAIATAEFYKKYPFIEDQKLVELLCDFPAWNKSEKETVYQALEGLKVLREKKIQ